MPSPYSTGGGGTSFEHEVAATYLAAVLAGGAARGYDSGIASGVRLQQSGLGDPMDDVIVDVDVAGHHATLSVQIKHDLVWGEADDTFGAVVRAGWERVTDSSFTPGLDRIGIGVGREKATYPAYREVLEVARSSQDGDTFRTTIEQAGFGETHRGLLALVRTVLAREAVRAVTDDEVWLFLSSLVLVPFDLEAEGGRDRVIALDQLRAVLGAGRADRAGELYARLARWAKVAARTAGSLDRVRLQALLLGDGFDLEATADVRADLARLGDHAADVLADIHDGVGGVVLWRPETTKAFRDALAEAPFVALIGPPGIGKSVFLKREAERRQEDGPVIVLSGDRLELVLGGGWEAVANHLRLGSTLPEILLGASGGPAPVLFINDLHKATSEGARLTIRQLFRALAAVPPQPDGSPRWRVAVTAREEAWAEAISWLDLGALGLAREVAVAGLTPDDLRAVRRAVPGLGPLLADPAVGEVVANPFLLDRLSDARMGEGAPATEIEVSDLWWRRVVGGSGDAAGVDRQRALLSMGRAMLPAPRVWLSIEAVPGAPLASLRDDRVIRLDVGRDVCRFGHDVYEDWVLRRVLDQDPERLPEVLAAAGEPFGLVRAVQLLGCGLLERGDPGEWERLVVALDGAPLAKRWGQAMLAAPLISTRTAGLLAAVEPFLFADGGHRLAGLMRVLLTTEVDPQPLAGEGGGDHVDALALATLRAVPRVRPWMHFLGWMIPRADAIPQPLRPLALMAMERWQDTTGPGMPYRVEIATIAERWLADLNAEEPSRWR